MIIKKKRNLLLDENAVSEVLGVVLILTIVLSATTIYLSQQVPELTKDFEARHVDEVADDFSELDSLIDRIGLVAKQEGESTTATGTTPLKMSPDKVPIFGLTPPGSSLGFIPQKETFVIQVDDVDGGVGGGGGSGDWMIPNATHGFTDYYLEDDSSDVDVSFDEVKLASYTPEGDLTLNETERWLEGEHSYDQVIIVNNSTLYAYGFLKIHANSIYVDPSSNITADGKGLWGGTSQKDGDGIGGGKTGANESAGGGGAGYGEVGGNGSDNLGSGGSKYGDEYSTSIQMGSGGGGGVPKPPVGSGGSGGNGGGAIWLDAEVINITGGTISANGDFGLSGTHPKSGAGGGGSGGGILIKGRNVTISGTATLSAKGGGGGNSSAGNDGGGGGGAGGRIKVFNESGSVSLANNAGSGDDATGKDGGAGGEAGVYISPGEEYISSITHCSSGYFTSEVYDTGRNSTCYGNMTWNATLNGQTIEMKVRTDMFEDMRAAPDWPYCPEVVSEEGQNNISDINSLSSVSDGHRYIQYRAELHTDDATTTPVLHSVRINYNFSAPGGGGPLLGISSGIIKFQSSYLYYLNQELVYEHGAVIKCQGQDGGKRGFMLHRPSIDITNESGIPKIVISMVDLTGSDYSYSGSTTTSVETSYTKYIYKCPAAFPNLTINLSTDYYSIWGEWFNKTLKESGLTTPYHYNVSVNGTAKTVAVEFYGHEHGVQLDLEKTTVAVRI